MDETDPMQTALDAIDPTPSHSKATRLEPKSQPVEKERSSINEIERGPFTHKNSLVLNQAMNKSSIMIKDEEWG